MTRVIIEGLSGRTALINAISAALAVLNREGPSSGTSTCSPRRTRPWRPTPRIPTARPHSTTGHRGGTGSMTGCGAERRGGSRLATATLRGLGLLAADLGHALAVVPVAELSEPHISPPTMRLGRIRTLSLTSWRSLISPVPSRPA